MYYKMEATMDNIQVQKVLSNFDNTFQLLSTLESIIKVIQESCLDKEVYSKHYNLTSKEKLDLSIERNNYINLLSIALDKISSLKDLNLILEESLSCLKQDTNDSCR